jgi:glycosyltransferase involved in cell wall biosynthesis
VSLRGRFSRLIGGDEPRESMLFISPVMPALHGNGLAMRAAQTMLAFATRYRVTLLVVPIYGSPAGRSVPEPIQPACARSIVVSPKSGDRPELNQRFDIVHLFRLAAVPLAEPWLIVNAGRAQTWLDMDDLESEVHRRIAELHRSYRDESAAEAELARANDARAREADAFNRFDRVFLASGGEGGNRSPGRRAELMHLPNVLPLPELLPEPPDGEPVVLLFVGTLGYFPNVEGALWFARDVLPLIQRESRRSVELRVVGMGWMPLVEQLRRLPGVALIGPVPEIRPHYEQAQLVVAPLRAGGGTRIKIIEAFGLGRPVVATSIGIEGIDAVDGLHTLIANGAEAFALACLRLIDERDTRATIARRARSLAESRYSPATINGIVADWPSLRA